MLLPLYLFHASLAAHEEELHHSLTLPLLLLCNLTLVIIGGFFIRTLFKQKDVKKIAVYFGITLAVNFVMVVILGGIQELIS